MIIDSHVHLGRNQHINATVDQLLASMDKAGIDKSLVYAGELNHYSTSMMLEEIKPHRDRLYGVASWDFNYSPYGHGLLSQRDYLRKLYQAGDIVAVKFYTGYYHVMPNELGDDILACLNEIGCPAIFHCGDCLNTVKRAKLKYAHPLNIDEVAVDYHKMNFIIAHMGYPWVRDTAQVCYKNDNVFADISGLVYGDFTNSDRIRLYESLKEFLEIASPDKLLFGSDFPIANQSSYVKTVQGVASDYFATYPKETGVQFTPQYMTQNTQRAFKL